MALRSLPSEQASIQHFNHNTGRDSRRDDSHYSGDPSIDDIGQQETSFPNGPWGAMGAMGPFSATLAHTNPCFWRRTEITDASTWA